MNEKDIQRKIDLQLDHLRNEFNERLQEIELKLREVEEFAIDEAVLAEWDRNKRDKKGVFAPKNDSYYFRIRYEDYGLERIILLWSELVGAGCIDRGHIKDFLECFTGEVIMTPPFDIKWLKSKSLAVYLFTELADQEWIDGRQLDKKIESILGIKNSAQIRVNYRERNVQGRPKDHVIIDDIIADLQKFDIDPELAKMALEFNIYKMEKKFKS